MTKVKSYKRRVKKPSAWSKFVAGVEITYKIAGLLFFLGILVISLIK